MIPIRDTIRSSKTPYVVYALIALNAAAFAFEIGQGLLASHRGDRAILDLFLTYGMVPARYDSSDFVLAAFGRPLGLVEQGIPFLTSLFLHGGIWHFVGNMWVLWIFGDNVEDWMGHVGFAVFYLASGLAAGLVHLAAEWGSTVPTIGASGAIAGVMGAYFVLYPRARIVTAIPIFIFIHMVELPAFVFLGFWFLIQLLSGSGGAASSIAWWAHIGGFVFGAVVVFLFGGRRRPRRTPGGQQRNWRPQQGERKLSDRIDDYWR